MSPALLALSGVLVGAIVGMTGVGGGSLMTPILVLAFGVSPVSAVGTDLLYASITKTAGTMVHGRNGTILWRIAGLLAAGSIPAALASVFIIRMLDTSPGHANTLLSRALGVCLLFTAITVFLRPWILQIAKQGQTELSPRVQAILTVLMGVMLGVLVTFTSVGAGAIGVTALILLYPRAPMASIVGTDIVHAVPLTLVAGLAHAATGTVNWETLGWLLLGSIPGIILGSTFATRANERVLRIALAAVLLTVGSRLALA